MQSIISAIYDQCPLDHIRQLVKQIPADELWNADSDGLDIIHHAILANNAKCLALIGDRSPMASSDELTVSSTPNCYLHLACLVGFDRIVAAICECPDVDISTSCSAVSWPSIDVIHSCIKRSGRLDGRQSVEKLSGILQRVMQPVADDVPPLHAIDVAALAGNIECVTAILNSSVVQYSSKRLSLLEHALELRSLHAFNLLLSQGQSADIVESAFRRALGRKLAVFVNALLDYGVIVSRALDGVNPYHYMYLCSPNFHRQRANLASPYSSGIDVMTDLLIKRSFDVNALETPGTFPLYSIMASLIQEKDYNPGSVPYSYFKAVEMLIRAGAQTDVDEYMCAKKLNKNPTFLSASAGRELATSGLNAYFVGLQTSDTWRPHIAEHLDRMCLTLLESGADASLTDSVHSTPLHDLMRAIATQHAIGHMHADLSTMSRMLLYFGANPNAINANGQYPVEVYFVLLLSCMGGLIAFRRWKATNNAAQVIHILYFMDAGDACEVRRRILCLLDNARSDGMPDDVVQFVRDMMSGYVFEMKSLQELAKLALWKAARRRISVLHHLHMPRAFHTAISDLFNLDIQ